MKKFYNKFKSSKPSRLDIPIAVLIVAGALNLPACGKQSKEERGNAFLSLAGSPIEMFASCAQIKAHVDAVRILECGGSDCHGGGRPVAMEDRAPSAPGRANGINEASGNRQEAGVAEADFTAIGSHHIVVTRGNKVTTLNRKGLSQISQLYQKDDQQIQGTYIDGDRLVIIANSKESLSSISIFRLEATKKPQLHTTKEFAENITQSRVTGGHLVAVMRASIRDNNQPDKTNDEINDEINDELHGISCTNIAKPQVNPLSTTLTKVVSIDLSEPTKAEKSLGVLAGIDEEMNFSAGAPSSMSGQIYMNESSLFLSEATYQDTIGLHKIALDKSNGNISLVASGKVSGFIRNAFAMREIIAGDQAFLAIATNSLHIPSREGDATDGDFPERRGDQGNWSERPVVPVRRGDMSRSNNLFLLKQAGNKLLESGRVTGLAPGEQIMAVRYVESVAYLVTFRQVDPLYAIDIKDPHNPKLVGELKVPGFSAYLHPTATGRLLGVGVGDTGGGVKLSLFDVSKPAEMKELSVLSMPGYSEVNQNHQAFYFDGESQMAVVPITPQSSQLQGSNESAIVVSISGDKITQTGGTSLSQNGAIRRTFKIDGMLLTISDSEVVFRDLMDPTKVLKRSSAAF